MFKDKAYRECLGCANLKKKCGGTKGLDLSPCADYKSVEVMSAVTEANKDRIRVVQAPFRNYINKAPSCCDKKPCFWCRNAKRIARLKRLFGKKGDC